eukprot:3645170-Rhodomonas_salina.2
MCIRDRPPCSPQGALCLVRPASAGLICAVHAQCVCVRGGRICVCCVCCLLRLPCAVCSMCGAARVCAERCMCAVV